jgi:hypothetical protein
MSKTISYKLRGQALEWANKFSNDLGIPLNLAAERALLWAIRKAYEESGKSGTLDPHTESEAVAPTPTEEASNG